MRKTALTFSLITACLSFGIVLPAEATPFQIAQQRRLEFQGWDFYASNMSYLTSGGRTEARITLNIRNFSSSGASLTLDEVVLISSIVLVDAQGRTYSHNGFDTNKIYGKSFFYGENLAIQLSFDTPPALNPRFLLIERSQGDPIRLPL